MPERCAIVGVGQTKHDTKRIDVSQVGLVREAALRALEDAEMTWKDVDALVIGKAPDLFEGVMMPELFLADALGCTGKPMLRVHTAGSVGGSTAIVAASRVEGDAVRSRTPGWCGSMRWSMPRIQTGRSLTRRATSPAAITTAVAPSVIGGQSCLRSGDTRYGSARIFSTSKSPLSCANGLSLASRRLRTATSAISRSVCAVASRTARAWSAARLMASMPRGASV